MQHSQYRQPFIAGSVWWNGSGPPAPPAQRDLYYGVHPAAAQGGPGERAKIADIAAINALFAEFDAKDFGDSKPAALAHLQQVEPPPSAIVDSGGGYHAYWLLLNPWQLLNDTERERARELQARWVAYVGGDPAAKDLARVLRVPGTFNSKYEPARPVAVERLDMGITYDLGELAAYCAPPAQPQPAPAPSAPAQGPTTDRRAAYGRKALADELARVATAGPGTRNDTLNAAAFTLGRKVAAGLLVEHEVEQQLVSAAIAAGLGPRESLATVRSGLAAGIAKGAPDNLPDFDAPAERPGPASALEADMQRPRLGLAERLAGQTVNAQGQVTTDPKAAARALRWAQEAPHTTDLGNARRLVRLFGERICYVHKWGKWLIYDGTRWAEDETGEIDRLARETVKAMYAEAAGTDDSGARKELARWATASEGAGKLRAMVDLAKSEPGIAVHHAALNADPWLLNCRNGTIDLRTGALRPHSPADFITKRIDVDFDLAAPAPLWESFITRITEGGAELAAYMQRAAGYTLTGVVREQCLFFCYGTGANGKSTFVETLATLLGGYWQKAPTEMIMLQRNGGGIPNDLARLPGARMVVTGELAQGRKLDEAKVKDMTGGDTLVARFMREEFFEFRPVFKLWMYGNHKPGIRGDDHGIWRRIRLIPFTATIPEGEKDPAFPEKLERQLSGILAWAVRGCLDWQRDGLTTPEAVQQATEAYRSEMDTVGAFLDECCVLREHAQAPATPLYKAYAEWCEANGERAMPQRDFAHRLDARGLPSKRTKKTWLRLGVGLLTADQWSLDDAAGDPVIPGDPKIDMNGASESLMGHVENRITTDHRITSDEHPGPLDQWEEV